MNTLLIRADGGTRIGAGHIMRCLALAQAWQAYKGLVVFLVSEISPALRVRLLDENIEVREISVARGSPTDANETIKIFKDLRASWLVLDGYEFKDDFQHAVSAEIPQVLALDDYGQCKRVHARLVLNQNPHAQEGMYPELCKESELLLGCSYALLRKEFLQSHKRERTGLLSAEQVLVTLGGSDPQNVTLQVLRVLQALELPRLRINLIVGGSNPHLAQLKQITDSRVQLIQDVQDMTTWLNACDFAISNGGVTCLELAFLGVPFATVSLTNDQRLNAEALEKMGVAPHLGWSADLRLDSTGAKLHDLLSHPAQLEMQSKKGRELVDGKGADRVVERMFKQLP